jgi:cell division protein FtsW
MLYGLGFGLLGFFLATKVYYRYYEKMALPLLILGITLLLLIFTPLGISAGGATRWLQLGPISFQPSEIMKFILIIYLAAWMSHNQERQKNIVVGLISFVVILSSVLLLLIKQPATSASVILAISAFVMYFVSGAKIRYLIITALLMLAVLFAAIVSSSYRWDRVQAFLYPEQNLQTTGYQVNQAKIAIGNGGFWGVGYGKSTAKINYLPEPLNDSIFAIIAEEFGFAGSVTLITLFTLLVLRILLLAGKTRDKFGQLILVGFGCTLALQSFTNIAAISGLIPLTGTPLPFISYGGTALVMFMTMIGISNNIARYS